MATVTTGVGRRGGGLEVGKEGGDSFLTVTKGVVVAAYMADDMADSGHVSDDPL